LVKVIMGLKGSGKTKQLIELANRAVMEESGNVVCIECGRQLTYDLSYKVRLIDVMEYDLKTNYDCFYSFICGIYAQNFDVSHIFIDGLYKVTGSDDVEMAEKFMETLDAFSKKNNVSFTVMISDSVEKAGEGLKRFF